MRSGIRPRIHDCISDGTCALLKSNIFPGKLTNRKSFCIERVSALGQKSRAKGESIGERDGSDGARTSSLKFWSEDPKSLIETGSGYWKYVPAEDCVRFFTWYDYETRFGLFGKTIDKLMFRPLLGWATAWSFDRLRLWIEKGIPPEGSRDRAITYALSRGTLAFVWFYHGWFRNSFFTMPLSWTF
jgi:hypothetical protein